MNTSSLPTVVHLLKAAADAGDVGAQEALGILAADAAVTAKEVSTRVVDEKLTPVMEEQRIISDNMWKLSEGLTGLGAILRIPGMTPAAEEPETPAELAEPMATETPAVGDEEMLPDPPEDIFLDEEVAEEDLDEARAAEEALPATARPVGPGGEPPAEPDDDQ